MMALKLIAVSETNYETLKNFGRAGDSFNDVVTDLIRRVKIDNSPTKKQPKRSIGLKCEIQENRPVTAGESFEAFTQQLQSEVQ